MNTDENITRNTESGLIPVLSRPKEYPFEVPPLYWLTIFVVIALSLVSAIETFSSTGRFWAVLFISVLLLLLVHSYLEMKQCKRRAIFLENHVFPCAIKKELATHYPHLSDTQVALVIQGLRQYFQLCNLAGQQTVSMPSRVVDAAWHEFILLTHSYAQFCENGLGRFLHHLPAAEESSSKSILEGLKVAWIHACRWENIDQKRPSRLPFLFGIDAALQIPDGFIHALNNTYASDADGFGGGVGWGGVYWGMRGRMLRPPRRLFLSSLKNL